MRCEAVENFQIWIRVGWGGNDFTHMEREGERRIEIESWYGGGRKKRKKCILFLFLSLCFHFPISPSLYLTLSPPYLISPPPWTFSGFLPWKKGGPGSEPLTITKTPKRHQMKKKWSSSAQVPPPLSISLHFLPDISTVSTLYSPLLSSLYSLTIC